MTTTTLADEERRAFRAQLFLEQLEAAGLSPADLVSLQVAGALPDRVSSADFLAKVRVAAPPGSAHVYGTYWDLLTEGLTHLCGCFCEECLGVFGRFDPDGEPLSSPCGTEGRCGCAKRHFFHPDVASCAVRYEGIGDKTLAAVTRLDIETAQRWAQTRAQKRWATHNNKRAARGRAQFDHTGKSAVEPVRRAASFVFTRALEDPSTGVRANVALQAPEPARPTSASRAYTEVQLAELWDAIFTTGGDDPELDMLIVWFHLETRARRGGAIRLSIGDLDLGQRYAKLVEKNDKVDWQPMSAELQRSLIGHAVESGDVVAWTAPGLDPRAITVDDVVAGRARLRPDQPVFYYRPSKEQRADGTVVLVPHPLTRRRYNTLWDRICRHLPWADQMHARPHDLCKLGGEFVKRACSYAIAKAWLRHRDRDRDTTLLYTKARPEEVARAFELLGGRNHPLAEGALRTPWAEMSAHPLNLRRGCSHKKAGSGRTKAGSECRRWSHRRRHPGEGAAPPRRLP